MVQNISCKSLFLNSPYIANCISPLQIELVLYLFVHLNVGIEMIGKFTINLAVSRLIPFVFSCSVNLIVIFYEVCKPPKLGTTK